MPTYTCWYESGLLGTEQKAAIAGALTEIHHDVANAPRYFVQAVFTELTPGSLYIAGQPAAREHLWVRADIRAGRTEDQKRRLLERITAEVGAIAGVPAEEVWVYVSDIPGPSVAEYGRPLPEPGAEDAWFDALPEDLRERLSALR